MTDRRLIPANGRVAAKRLEGAVTADRFITGDPARVARPVADLRDAPNGARQRQLIWGEAVTVYERRDGWAFVESARDGYVGYLAEDTVGPAQTPTHRVATPATHLYQREAFKSGDIAHLSFGSRVTVTAERAKFWETPEGYIPKKHLRPLDKPFTDPATVAQLYFGVPYLWGGNSIRGIDCSGLVQASLLACDIACPGDSDQQREWAGRRLDPGTAPERGDLIFWKGHVGIMVDGDTLLHANAHHMAVAYEPFAAACMRIEAQGDGPVLAHRRP